MAIVTYHPPFEHVYGSIGQTVPGRGMICSHHGETGDVVRTRGEGEHVGGYGPFPGWLLPRPSRDTPQFMFDNATKAWSDLGAPWQGLWHELAEWIHHMQPAGVPHPRNAQNLFVSVQIFRQLAGLPMTKPPPGTNNIPGPACTLGPLTASSHAFSGAALTPDAPDGAFLHLRATNSRPGQARLFTLNDLRIPTAHTPLSFIPILSAAATWTITPDVVTIRAGEAIGIETRLLSADFLPLIPQFSRLEIVGTT